MIFNRLISDNFLRMDFYKTKKSQLSPSGNWHILIAYRAYHPFSNSYNTLCNSDNDFFPLGKSDTLFALRESDTVVLLITVFFSREECETLLQD